MPHRIDYPGLAPVTWSRLQKLARMQAQFRLRKPLLFTLIGAPDDLTICLVDWESPDRKYQADLENLFVCFREGEDPSWPVTEAYLLDSLVMEAAKPQYDGK